MIIEGYAYLGKRNPEQEILLTVYKSPRDKAEKVTVELRIESSRTQSGVQIEGEGIPVFKPIKCRNEWREEEPNG